ncbi:phosphorylase [Methylobacterium aquaticum]|uniref:Phosphorylase n=1 Tax=Methylobacterium aquaticum TaxID=270351 RepID=A0A0J6S612_9HYPH|nr:phosphorylase [Methylobacterium aquaticum]KMO29119.1 phosphorylase [Methylobacterium aquaticum]
MIVVEDSAAPSGPHPVLAVTGLAREARLAAGPGVATVGAGGNPERLRDLLRGRAAPGCRAVMSIGIAGGLDPNLVPGDVVVATGVSAGGVRHPAHPQVVAALARRLVDAPARVIEADVVGVEAAVLSPHAKAQLRAETGAAVVDMESHVAAAFAEAHGLPFCAVRVVCDPADRALPAAIAKALKPDGEPDLLAVLAALARRSASVGGLIRLARDSSAAFASLGRCRALLGVGLGVPDLGELLRDVA